MPDDPLFTGDKPSLDNQTVNEPEHETVLFTTCPLTGKPIKESRCEGMHARRFLTYSTGACERAGYCIPEADDMRWRSTKSFR